MAEIFWQYRSQAQWFVLIVIVAIAYRRGASPERQVATVFVAMFVLDRLYHLIFGSGLRVFDAEIGHALIDTVVFGAFVTIALRANRMYPLWLASFQLMIIASHVARAANPFILSGAYAILAFAPSYLEVATFALGLATHMRRNRKFGPYRSWQDS